MPAKKITAGICVIFRGLFFEHNAACQVVAITKTEDLAKRPFMDGHGLGYPDDWLLPRLAAGWESQAFCKCCSRVFSPFPGI